MGAPSYLSQSNEGIIIVNCATVPSKGFLDAVKTKDIAKIKFLSRTEKESNGSFISGGPDVRIQSLTGEYRLISRRELVSNYVHASGNRIKLAFLKNNKEYLVVGTCRVHYKIMKLPNNCVALLPNGKKSSRGGYIVAMEDENGQVNRDTIAAISTKMFRKMFRVQMQAPLKRAMEPSNPKTKKVFTMFSKNRPVKSLKTFTPSFNSNELGMNPANINIESVNDNKQTQNMWKPSSGIRGKASTQQNNIQYKYKATHKVVDMNKKLMGYTILEIKSGKTRNLTPLELSSLCERKLVENVMLVTNQQGNKFLKGNGCVLNNLPEVII